MPTGLPAGEVPLSSSKSSWKYRSRLPRAHGADRSHASIFLERAALIEDQLAGAFIRAREQVAGHHGAGPHRERLHDIPEVRMPPSAITGMSRFAAAAAHSAIDEIIGMPMPATMRVVQIDPAPMPTFTASTPIAIKRLGGFSRRHVAGDQIEIGERLAQLLDDVHHALRMSVRGVDDEHVDVRVDQGGGALQGVARDADRRADAQAAERILARVRILDGLLDVLDGDQALEPEVLVDDEQLLDFRGVQDLLRLVERGADRHGDQPLLGHHFRHRPRRVGLEPQIAIGENADEAAFLAAVLGDRHAGDAVLLHQIQRVPDQRVRGDGDRIDDHAALRSLDAIDLERLVLDRQVLVDDAHAALLAHGDRHLGLGDRVHGGAEQRDVELDVLREARADVDLRGQHRRVARHQQDVVEGEGRPEVGADDLFSFFDPVSGPSVIGLLPVA